MNEIWHFFYTDFKKTNNSCIFTEREPSHAILQGEENKDKGHEEHNPLSSASRAGASLLPASP